MPRYRILSIDNKYELFPNGDDKFLTKSSLKMLNNAREDVLNSGVETSDLMPYGKRKRNAETGRLLDKEVSNNMKNWDHYVDNHGKQKPRNKNATAVTWDHVTADDWRTHILGMRNLKNDDGILVGDKLRHNNNSTNALFSEDGLLASCQGDWDMSSTRLVEQWDGEGGNRDRGTNQCVTFRVKALPVPRVRVDGMSMNSSADYSDRELEFMEGQTIEARFVPVTFNKKRKKDPQGTDKKDNNRFSVQDQVLRQMDSIISIKIIEVFYGLKEYINARVYGGAGRGYIDAKGVVASSHSQMSRATTNAYLVCEIL